MIRRRPPRMPSPRKGQLLMEFAFIALILYMLLAGIIDFGRAMFAAQVIQQAVDASARELSRTPIPPTGTLTGPAGMFATNTAAQQIYQPQYLVVSPGQLAPGQSLTDFFADKPLLNRLLMPLMIWNADLQVWQYPGQVGTDAGFGPVTIPIVQYNGDGTYSIPQFIPVVEEISVNPADDPLTPIPDDSPFNLLAANVPPSQRGFIALRVNYPFQAAALTSYQGVAGSNPPMNGPPTEVPAGDQGADFGPYAGPSGLGQQAALGKVVRPFRKVLSAQAIFRREVFE